MMRMMDSEDTLTDDQCDAILTKLMHEKRGSGAYDFIRAGYATALSQLDEAAECITNIYQDHEGIVEALKFLPSGTKLYVKLPYQVKQQDNSLD